MDGGAAGRLSRQPCQQRGQAAVDPAELLPAQATVVVQVDPLEPAAREDDLDPVSALVDAERDRDRLQQLDQPQTGRLAQKGSSSGQPWAWLPSV
jgi:hypothetical protein